MSNDPAWQALRRLTAARIGLGRAGASLATADHLTLRAAHAAARDAVSAPLDVEALTTGLRALGLDPLLLHAAAADQATHLTRPDLGRQLAPLSRAALEKRAGNWDLVVLVAGGLSALAARHAPPLLAALLPLLPPGTRIGPACLVERGRVALGDAVGEALAARMVLVLIGERPGLSSVDSLGAYLTWAPRVGRSDAERNCVSNIRPGGMGAMEAARRLTWLMGQATQRGLTGVALKDDSGAELPAAPEPLRVGPA